MEQQRIARHIAPPGGVAAADILHVAQQVTLSVLRAGFSHIGANAPERGGDLIPAAALDRQAADQGKTPSHHDLIGDFGQRRSQRRQQEIVLVDILEVQTTRLNGCYGLMQLSDFRRRQAGSMAGFNSSTGSRARLLDCHGLLNSEVISRDRVAMATLSQRSG
jgi:hypothetical protein